MRRAGDDDGQRRVGHCDQAAPHRGDVRRAAAGTLAAAGAALVGKVHPEAVHVASDGVGHAVVDGCARAAAALQLLGAAQDVAADNLAESSPELPDAVCIDEGVNDGVAVGQNYGHVHDDLRRPLTPGTEEGEAVDDVQRQPAHRKQPHDDGQRLGSLDLLLQRGARFFSVHDLQLNQLELVPSGHEDAQVDAQHEQQGEQHAGEKVEVDHVSHEHHVFKQAPDQARGALVRALGCFVPAHHGGEADDDGQNPANGDNALSPPARHQAVVPGGKRKTRHQTAGAAATGLVPRYYQRGLKR